MRCKLLILAFLCCSLTVFAQNNTIDYKKGGAPMPAIRLIVPDLTQPAEVLPPTGKKKPGKAAAAATQTITDKELDNQANLLVMLFNPTCGHCEDQTQLLREHIELFKKSKLVLMAGAGMIPYLDQFNNATHVTEFPKTIVMGVDSSQFIDKTFLYESLPQINIYDHERKLIRSFNGPTPLDTLRRYIE